MDLSGSELGAQGQGPFARLLGLSRIGRLPGGPSAHVALAEVGQRVQPVGVVVQAGDVVERLAPGMQKGFAGLLVDFFQRFNAVAAEPGRYTLSKLRSESGINGPFKASDKTLRAAIKEAVDFGMLIERPATVQDVKAYGVRRRDCVFDVGVGNVS